MGSRVQYLNYNLVKIVKDNFNVNKVTVVALNKKYTLKNIVQKIFTLFFLSFKI